ncbi:hypothetical protein BD410DRAFT_290121 [Rickenella mellea]|uniref:Response regulatory domain-containing protein n=1 Tax=Rickenella mellea TaxID=50990 RepID=A0A4Y7Q283_9AGAM|nr:hypothetical protein BD410DRAFT_290121 [Rickenella mellea]
MSGGTDIIERLRAPLSHLYPKPDIRSFIGTTTVDSPEIAQVPSHPRLYAQTSSLPSNSLNTLNTLSPSASAELRSPRVLIVDDASICRNIYTRMLVKRGISIWRLTMGEWRLRYSKSSSQRMFGWTLASCLTNQLQMPVCGGLESARMTRHACSCILDVRSQLSLGSLTTKI